MSASFQTPEDGPVASGANAVARAAREHSAGAATHRVHCDSWKTGSSYRQDKPRAPFKRVWFRANGELADDPLLHACLLTYQSDSDLMSTSRLPHGRIDRSRMQRASLDHALWFHRPVRVDEWLLVRPRQSVVRVAGPRLQSRRDVSGRRHAGRIRDAGMSDADALMRRRIEIAICVPTGFEPGAYDPRCLRWRPVELRPS